MSFFTLLFFSDFGADATNWNWNRAASLHGARARMGEGIGIVVGYSFHPDHPYVSDLGGFTEGARNGSRGCLT